MKKRMTPQTLRGGLSLVIVILIVLAGVGFYFARDWLGSFAVSTGNVVAESRSSGGDEQELKKLQEELAAKQNIISKTNQLLVPTSKYQTQAIKDLNAYATYAGITVSNFGFSNVESAQVTAGQSVAPHKTVTVALLNPISYENLIKFMHAIESNLPKMQISNVNISRSSNGTSVDVNSLTVKVYTR